MAGLTFSQIMRYVDAQRIELSYNVKVKSLKTKTPRQTNGVFGLAEAKTWSREEGRWQKYDTAIEFYPKNRVVLSCSCPDFMYRWEYALAMKRAARIVYGNGDPPESANPGNKPGCCKHIVRLHSLLSSKGLIEK